MESSEFENLLVVHEQHEMISACEVGIDNTLQELEKVGNKDDPSPDDFVAEFKENVEQGINVVMDNTSVILVDKEPENKTEGATKNSNLTNGETILQMDDIRKRDEVTNNTKTEILNTDDNSARVHSVVMNEPQPEIRENNDLPQVVCNDAQPEMHDDIQTSGNEDPLNDNQFEILKEPQQQMDNDPAQVVNNDAQSEKHNVIQVSGNQDPLKDNQFGIHQDNKELQQQMDNDPAQVVNIDAEHEMVNICGFIVASDYIDPKRSDHSTETSLDNHKPQQDMDNTAHALAINDNPQHEVANNGAVIGGNDNKVPKRDDYSTESYFYTNEPQQEMENSRFVLPIDSNAQHEMAKNGDVIGASDNKVPQRDDHSAETYFDSNEPQQEMENTVHVLAINNDEQYKKANNGAVIEGNDNKVHKRDDHSAYFDSNKPQQEMKNSGPVLEVKNDIQPEIAKVKDVLLGDGKTEPKPRDENDVIDDTNDRRLRRKEEDDSISETRKTDFVSPTSADTQADVWIKAGGPLSSKGRSLVGRRNKVGFPYTEEGTLMECGNKAGVRTSKEDSLLVAKECCTKEHISSRSNVIGVNGESVELLEDLQDNYMGRCPDAECYDHFSKESFITYNKAEENKEKKKIKTRNEKKMKDSKQKKEDKKESNDRKNKSFLNRIIQLFCCCISGNDEISKKDVAITIKDSKKERLMKDARRKKSSLAETRLSTTNGNIH